MPTPAPSILPLDAKPLTPSDAAAFLRGLAELVEAYPAPGLLLTVAVQVAGHAATPPSPKKPRRPRTTS